MSSIIKRFKRDKLVVKSKVLSNDLEIRSKQLYNTKKWKDLRLIVLQKRGGLCEHCIQNNIIQSAIVVDHITPHRGLIELFYKEDNLQILCKQCHDIKTYSETITNINTNVIKVNSIDKNKNIRVLCCPPGYNYTDNLEDGEVVLDEYVIAQDIYKRIDKQTLLIAKQNKKKIVNENQNKKRVWICYEYAHAERHKLLNSFELESCTVIIPELYLIHDAYKNEAEQWIKRFTSSFFDIIKRKS